MWAPESCNPQIANHWTRLIISQYHKPIYEKPRARLNQDGDGHWYPWSWGAASRWQAHRNFKGRHSHEGWVCRVNQALEQLSKRRFYGKQLLKHHLMKLEKKRWQSKAKVVETKDMRMVGEHSPWIYYPVLCSSRLWATRRHPRWRMVHFLD